MCCWRTRDATKLIRIDHFHYSRGSILFKYRIFSYLKLTRRLKSLLTHGLSFGWKVTLFSGIITSRPVYKIIENNSNFWSQVFTESRICQVNWFKYLPSSFIRDGRVSFVMIERLLATTPFGGLSLGRITTKKWSERPNSGQILGKFLL